MSIRVLLADDHAIVRQGIRVVLEQEGFEVVGEASDGQEAIQLAQRLQPEIAVFDVTMPVLNGIDAARQIAKTLQHTKVILLSMHSDNEYVVQGLRAGAIGYVLKTNPLSELVQAIRKAIKGERYLGSNIAPVALEKELLVDSALDPLTSRERQVLQLVAEGHTTKEIGTLLFVSTKTADTHRCNIMNKLNIHSTANLVRYAVRVGLVK